MLVYYRKVPVAVGTVITAVAIVKDWRQCKESLAFPVDLSLPPRAHKIDPSGGQVMRQVMPPYSSTVSQQQLL